MPMRMVLQRVIVMREGKRTAPKIGEPFQFTAAEVDDIAKSNAKAVRTLSREEIPMTEERAKAKAHLGKVAGEATGNAEDYERANVENEEARVEGDLDEEITRKAAAEQAQMTAAASKAPASGGAAPASPKAKAPAPAPRRPGQASAGAAAGAGDGDEL